MVNDYIKLFEKRGHQYHHAMELYPNARQEEFLQAINKVTLKNGMCIGDIPAGGEYLTKFLPPKTLYFPYEPCGGFDTQIKEHIHSQMLLPLPFENGSLDVVFSIAGIHHLENKKELFQEIFRVTKPEGCFVLSDVKSNSNVANFLDNFMGKHNSTGHKGIFLSEETSDELFQCGFKVLSATVEKFHWVFDTLEEMAIFCNTLFDIDKSDIPNTLKAIEEYLGTVQLDDKVGMNWELMTIVAKKI